MQLNKVNSIIESELLSFKFLKFLKFLPKREMSIRNIFIFLFKFSCLCNYNFNKSFLNFNHEGFIYTKFGLSLPLPVSIGKFKEIF